jgi:hypothetical protein
MLRRVLLADVDTDILVHHVNDFAKHIRGNSLCHSNGMCMVQHHAAEVVREGSIKELMIQVWLKVYIL